MKRIIMIIALITLTGCTKKMLCTNNTETEMLKTEEKLILKYNGNKIKNVENEVKYTIKDENIKESFKKIFDTIKENYNKNNINYNEEITENIYKFNVTYSPSNMDDETLNNLNSAKDLKTYKKKILDQGLRCE